VGKLLDPYSPQRLLEISGVLSVLVVLISSLCLWNLEGPAASSTPASYSVPDSLEMAMAPLEAQTVQKRGFKETLHMVWSEPQAKAFTVFVFLSMLAYSSQDLILEPFAGALFGLTPGETTQLSGLHHSSVLGGMLAVALAGSSRVAGRLGSIQRWMVGGCWVSGLAMVGLCFAAAYGPPWPLKPNVILLGLANGSFSIAAIATMMRLATQGGDQHAGTRMGLWGASQALAFGLGGLLGTVASDLAHYVLGEQGTAYAYVFAFESVMFVLAATCAIWVGHYDRKVSEPHHSPLSLSMERI